ncbi:hypothetical protein FACS1894102_3450 [Spirochaetia bacterium]|nr:hypothetical protein FACS1894102_3450 [Spirochaetia bacterium]
MRKTTKNDWSKILLTVMAAMVLTFGLVFTGCATGKPPTKEKITSLNGTEWVFTMDNLAMKYTFTDKNWELSINEKGKISKFTGAYTFADNKLSIKDDNAPTYETKIINKPPRGYYFEVQGAPFEK